MVTDVLLAAMLVLIAWHLAAHYYTGTKSRWHDWVMIWLILTALAGGFVIVWLLEWVTGTT